MHSVKEQRQRLIEHLQGEGFLKSPEVIRAFEKIPREMFVPENFRSGAYADEPLPIGYGQTISAPHMNAWMTELLEIEKTHTVLEIGTGSGYQAALLARLAKHVYTVELDGQLVGHAKRALKKAGIHNVTVILGDGAHGYFRKAPYDRILLSCGAAKIPPVLVDQLKDHGILVGPVGGLFRQVLTRVIKSGGELRTETFGSVSFVPLRKEINVDLAKP